MPRDLYKTPRAAFLPLIPHLPPRFRFCEPCAADGEFIYHVLSTTDGHCTNSFDIEPLHCRIKQGNALTMTKADLKGADFILTNSPWDRKIFHPLLDHWRTLCPSWVLIDAGWMFTKQAKPYMEYCAKVVPIGRVKWFPDTKMTGKEDCVWLYMGQEKTQTIFCGRN